MDYENTKREALQERDALLKRREEIAAEKRNLENERERIERRLAGLDQVLDGLETMTSDLPPDLEAPGFTDQIRRILQEADLHLTPVQIRDTLQRAGVKGSSDKNLLISVHTVIARLKPNLSVSEVDGKAAYRWNRPKNVFGVRRRTTQTAGTVPLATLMAGSGPPPAGTTVVTLPGLGKLTKP
ncbi:MAG TPA: hypothetical protein VL523_01245 [Terriglobia bacterium]|nr:hypothetical protein [Terriglobia bacterium]